MSTRPLRSQRTSGTRLASRHHAQRIPRAKLGKRKLAFESLDQRLVLSASLGTNVGVEAESHLSPPRAASAGAVAQDLVAFAKAIADSGTRFYGASWCGHCTAQKELFEDGAEYLPFIEVTNLDSPVTMNEVGLGNNQELNPTGVPISSFPTWEFPDNSRLSGSLSLETLSARSGVPIPSSFGPFIAPIKLVDSDIDKDNIRDDVDNDFFNDGVPNEQNDTQIVPRQYDDDGDEILTVLVGSPLHVAFDGYDPSGDPLTFTVTSSDPSLVFPTLLTDNRSMTMDVSGWGKMTFQLFEQRAPRPTGQIIELAEMDFYDDIVFHRIINGFVIQGGDPTGEGSGGSPLGDFDDQFHEELQHNRNGTFSYAKSADDTNDSQFFITEGPTRHLDGNHSIAGVIVEGDKNREAISNISQTDSPTVAIDTVEIFSDTENAVALLTATPGATGTVEITVTATDTDSNQFTREFTVNIADDQSDTSPWLDELGDLVVIEGTTTNTQIRAIDIEGDPIRFGVVTPTNFTITVPSEPITPHSPAVADVAITPNPDFSGSEEITFFVLDAGINVDGVEFSLPLLQNNSSLVDFQTITLTSELNTPPSVVLTETTTSLPEDTDTTTRIKVGNIVVTDDGVGDNQLSLSGNDAEFFEIVGTELYLSANTELDFSNHPTIDVAVLVNDSTAGVTPDDFASLSIAITEVSWDAELSGRVFMDLDGDGADNENAGPMVGFYIFADHNGNRLREPNEPISVTDIGGVYSFQVPLNTPVEIRMLRPLIWDLTSPTTDEAHALTASDPNSVDGLDFGLKFAATTWYNSYQPTNVNGVGGTTPYDALLIINELDEPTIHDPETGTLFPLSGPPDPLSFFDVDQSGFISPYDALLVINELPTSQPSAASSTSHSNSAPVAALSSIVVAGLHPKITTGVPAGNREQSDGSAVVEEPMAGYQPTVNLALQELTLQGFLDPGWLNTTNAAEPSNRDESLTNPQVELIDHALSTEI